MKWLLGPAGANDHFEPTDFNDGYRSSGAVRLLSHALLPTRLRDLAIDLTIDTEHDTYRVGESIDLRIGMRNRLPLPVQLTTLTPERWMWSVDGHPEGERVRPIVPEDEASPFVFDRSERKTFMRRWTGHFRISDREWEPASPGEYTVSVAINVDDPKRRGLYDEATIEIVQ